MKSQMNRLGTEDQMLALITTRWMGEEMETQ